MRTKKFLSAVATIMLPMITQSLQASPPAVGILSNSRNCLACHVQSGTWQDGAGLIIDILDKSTQQSLRQPDGTFLLTVRRGEPATVLTVIGSRGQDAAQVSYRNGWIYVDTTQIGSKSLSKFAPGWEVNLSYACRVVGDSSKAYPDAHVSSLPMTVRPTDSAQDAEVMLQLMLSKGETVKGNAKLGIIADYFERRLKLQVID